MATSGRKPELHVIAGSNGSGKSTLYERELQFRHPAAEFVNADRLSLAHFGHHAQTREEAEVGQRLANERREAAIAERRDVIFETVFSHPSKLDVLRQAKDAGYAIVVYHVGLRSADLAVERVALRVSKGGHPVNEKNIRERFERNQPLIREAVRMADRAYVADNSVHDQPHRLALVLDQGRAVVPHGAQVPGWVQSLYAEELRGYEPKQLNPAMHSFAEARAIAKGMIGDDARVFVAKPDGRYIGDVLAKTDMHTLQQVGAQSGIAHITRKLEPEPNVGAHVRVEYVDPQHAKVEELERDVRPSPHHKAMAEAFRTMQPADAVRAFPDLANAYAHVSAFSARMDVSGHPANEAMVRAFRQRLERGIEAGDQLEPVQIAETTRSQDHESER